VLTVAAFFIVFNWLTGFVMTKKSKPDSAASKSQTESGTNALPKKRRGFISEFDMWDINLDISSDDTIDPTIRSGESVTKKEPTGSKPVSESRAKTVPLQSRPVKAAKGSTSTTNKPAAASSTKSPGNRQQHSSARPVTKPAAKTSQPQAPVQKSTSRQVSQRRSASSSGAKTVKRTPQDVRNKAAGMKEQSTVNREARIHHRSGASARQQELPPKQTESAVFTTRDVNRKISPQNTQRVEELKKKKRRDKFLKVASLLWVVMDSLWMLTVKLVKFIWPVVYRHKMVVGAALLSFALGIYFGQQGKIVSKQVHTASTSKAVGVKQQSKSVSKLTKKPKPKIAAVKPKRTTHPRPAKPKVQPKKPAETVVTKRSTQEVLAPNQFSGKDIPLDDGAHADAGAVTAVASNPAVATTDIASSSVPQATLDVVPQASPSTAEDKSATMNEKPEDTRLQQLLNVNLNYFNQKQWQQVVETSGKILAINPFMEAALINRSVAYTELAQYNRAITDTNTLITMNKKNGVAFNNRAYAYEKAGFLEKSIVDYAKACKLGVQQSCNDVQRLKDLIETED
jgi:Tfp pilus assembly protein PilF